MGWVAPVLGVASTLFGASQQKKAAKAQANASQAGIDWTKEVYGDAQGNFSPYMQAGSQGLAALLGNNYEASPGYQYLKDEMMGAVDDRNANQGSYWSEGANLDMMRHVNGLAAQDYGNWWNRQAGLAQMGQNAAAQLGSIGVGSGAQINQGYQNMGNAQASGYGANAGAAYGLAGILGNYFQPKPQATQSSYSGGGSPYNWGEY